MPSLTIFTPTYNRSSTLLNLYHSLIQQTCQDFEWIIVDDGSTDNTEEQITPLLTNSPFPIKYIKKNNEGKHIAINEGVKHAAGKWFFIVDSDDALTSDAIEIALAFCNQIENDTRFAGVAGLRANANGVIWNNWFGSQPDTQLSIDSYIDGTYIDYRYKFALKGDRAEIVRTDIIKQYPFPKFSNEKFLVESYLWLSLAKAGYLFRWFNKPIYITEYLEDGLTRNIRNHYKNSPIGSYHVNNLRLSCKGIGIKEYIRSSYNYYRYGILAGEKTFLLFQKCNRKLLTCIGLPLALLRK